MTNQQNKNHKQKKLWQIMVRTMVTIVVFCTTYALILPAITMEQETICGLEEHVHTESCYEERIVIAKELISDDPQSLSEDMTATIESAEILLIEASVEGEISETTSETVLIGETEGEILPVIEETEEETAPVIIETESEVIEPFAESESEMAVVVAETESEVIETIEVLESETVEDEIETTEPKSEYRDVEKIELVLICDKVEHTHEEACYPEAESEKENSEYLCGSGAHAHSEGCYNEEGTLICTIPEHEHEAACIVEDLDLNADVEHPYQWEQMFENVKLSGNWRDDVLTIAISQLDYKESTKNVILEGESLKGYTRYGAWYGSPYGDWCAMFASFCLNYADVKDFPLEAEVNRWISDLKAQELYGDAKDYTAKPGDLIFFDYDQTRNALGEIPIDADHVGFVVEHIPATDTEPAKIKTIEGNKRNKVTYAEYELDDPVIIGYGKVPVGEKIILQYEGADFTVTVSMGRDAGIPEEAGLTVREILSGTEEYDMYYQQSVEALMQQTHADAVETEEELGVSFARFFDIGFVVDGSNIEPETPVDVQIRYKDNFIVDEGNTGLVVHFADEGTEVLDADTNEDEENAANTFDFTQNSFSVSGTLVAASARAADNTATAVSLDKLDGTGNTEYVIYTYFNGKPYAIAAPATGKTGEMVAITVNDDGTVTWNTDKNIRWTFVSTGDNTYDVTNENGRYLHAFYNGNGSDIGVIGTNSKGAALVSTGDYTFKVKHPSSNYYVGISGNVFQALNNNYNNAVTFYIAALKPSTYHVWFDGTDGGLMGYYGADNKYMAVDADNNTITLPTTWKSTEKYDYVLKGWYNINTHTYHLPGEKVPINEHCVFYADWVAATYNVGQNNEHVVNSINTSNFVTTHVFDYNVLFNVLSQTHTGTISSTSHKETWTIVETGGDVPYNNGKSLGFSFVDYDDNGEFSYPLGRDNSAGNDINTNQGDKITAGIIDKVNSGSGMSLLNLLFDPVSSIGKNYLGTGNYLFQYMDSTTSNYDGVHDGYYYLDARLNAASYNQSEQRFYLYDYLERTSDSQKDGGIGQYSDFLPFNSPYIFEQNQLDEYVNSVLKSGYEYDAKDGANSYTNYNSVDDATTNYFFGIRTDINFFLPNNTNTRDEYGNYGNISTRGEHMIFDFHGDDDVWVFVDGKLLLDIGGLHGVMFGQIDFSTGQIIVGKDGGTTTTTAFDLSEGTHTMTVYYMERGSSQSNCAIYFNIAPRYDLLINKEDIVSANILNGAVFTIYNDEAMASPAQLWDSEDAYNEDIADGVIDNAKSSFEVVGGEAKCWGISAGKTYYIYETKPPEGYPKSDDMIRITLNNRGTATIETTTLHGPNGIATEGYAVITQDINETLKIVTLTVTNQKEGRHTEVRVEKMWAEGSSNLPESIIVYLTADGVPVGRRAELNENNGWSYTWTGLDKYRAEGINEEVVYEVQEVLVPGYITTQGTTEKVENYVDWTRVGQLSDNKTFLLVHNGYALTYNGSFGWMDLERAKLDSSLTAQWDVTTDHDGFHLKNKAKYTLTYDPSGFYGVDNDDVRLNQVFYYLNSRLVVHQSDIYYQFGTNGSVVREDGLSFTLYQKDVITGFITNIINVPVQEEEQTYVEVTKVWNDGNDSHSDTSITVSLYADGEDTGRKVVLNKANDWKNGFYELPYYQEDGITVVEYTVIEEEVYNYVAKYSDPVSLEPLPISLWRQTIVIENGGLYRFGNGSYVLTEDNDQTIVSEHSDLDDKNQQWTAVQDKNRIVLQNVGSKNYLVQNNGVLSTVSRAASASSVTISENRVMIGNVYLEITSSHAGVTNNPENITNQHVSQYITVYGKDGVGYTITNVPVVAELPQTGGTGKFTFAFGGVLMLALASALMYRLKKSKGERLL